jgi:hypothetical protein
VQPQRASTLAALATPAEAQPLKQGASIASYGRVAPRERAQLGSAGAEETSDGE